jgi:hypothetical protein
MRDNGNIGRVVRKGIYGDCRSDLRSAAKEDPSTAKTPLARAIKGYVPPHASGLSSFQPHSFIDCSSIFVVSNTSMSLNGPDLHLWRSHYINLKKRATHGHVCKARLTTTNDAP